MKIVSYPQGLKERLIQKFGEMLDEGKVAEGEYYQAEMDYVPGKKSVPVVSCGAAIFALLAYQKFVHGKTHVIIQSNTMRGLYTCAKLLGMEVLICDSSSVPGFLAMDANDFADMIKKLDDQCLIDKVVTLYSVIGGFLAEDYFEIEKVNTNLNIPLIVDMAHGHYLQQLIGADYPHLAFSFYATKILPVGEGGLISTKDEKMFAWIKRFLAYDRFEYGLQVGLNLRTNELTSYFIHLLMTEETYKTFFRDYRVKIAEIYRRECEINDIRYLDFGKAVDYNGYKFVIFDDRESVKKKDTLLTKFTPTSPVFAEHLLDKHPILSHWCPPTYSSLLDEISGREEATVINCGALESKVVV